MESELMKLWGAPRTSWLVSGQDEPARAALLKAELSAAAACGWSSPPRRRCLLS